MGIVTSAAQLDDLRARLNTRGCREKALAAALERRAEELAAALDGGDGAPAMDLASLPRWDLEQCQAFDSGCPSNVHC